MADSAVGATRRLSRVIDASDKRDSASSQTQVCRDEEEQYVSPGVHALPLQATSVNLGLALSQSSALCSGGSCPDFMIPLSSLS